MRVCAIKRPRARSGFTLLEVLLASTILASMSVLLGVLWTGAGSMHAGIESLDRTLDLPRVVTLLENQWRERRALAVEAPDYSVGSDALEFVTSRPLLDTDWPLVRARYTLEDDPDQPHTERLVYRETRVTDVASAGVTLSPAPQTLVLLAHARALRFETTDDRQGEQESWVEPSIQSDSQPPRAIMLAGEVNGESFSCILLVEASPSR